MALRWNTVRKNMTEKKQVLVQRVVLSLSVSVCLRWGSGREAWTSWAGGLSWRFCCRSCCWPPSWLCWPVCWFWDWASAQVTTPASTCTAHPSLVSSFTPPSLSFFIVFFCSLPLLSFPTPPILPCLSLFYCLFPLCSFPALTHPSSPPPPLSCHASSCSHCLSFTPFTFQPAVSFPSLL